MRFRAPVFLISACTLLLAMAVPAVHAAPTPVKNGSHATAPASLVPPGWPKTFAMPRFNVRANVEALAFMSVSDVHAPHQWNDVAWYDRGPRPGDMGHATIFGHLDSTCCPAVFWQLHSLRAGDLIQVGYKNGKVLRFRVMWQGTYLNSKMPLKFMFGPAKQRGLTLVTCAGIFHRDGTGYDRKLIVYARMILPNGQLG